MSAKVAAGWARARTRSLSPKYERKASPTHDVKNPKHDNKGLEQQCTQYTAWSRRRMSRACVLVCVSVCVYVCVCVNVFIHNIEYRRRQCVYTKKPSHPSPLSTPPPHTMHTQYYNDDQLTKKRVVVMICNRIFFNPPPSKTLHTLDTMEGHSRGREKWSGYTRTPGSLTCSLSSSLTVSVFILVSRSLYLDLYTPRSECRPMRR